MSVSLLDTILKLLTSGKSSQIEVLHQALLHGVGPHQFRQGLNVMQD